MTRRSDLAVNGGKPVHVKPWRSGDFHFPEELATLKKVLSGPSLPLARGRWVMAYREQLTRLYGMKYAVTTSSGTAAVHAALAAAGIGAGDEVILSPLTDYGSIAGILQLNAIPIFADVQPDGLVMDVASVEARITPHTRAVMPIHIGGYVVDMPALMKLSRRHKLTVIEDCAQSHLASVRGRHAGTFGDIGVWSTNESKHMKSGEGGFLLTNSRKLAEWADLFSDKCYQRVPEAPPTPAFPALNYRLSDINAALALVQLRHLPRWIGRHQAFGDAMGAGIQGVPGVKPLPQPKGARPTYWMWTAFCVDKDVLGVDASQFCTMLGAEGIPASADHQRNILEWELFRRLNADPNAFSSYRPGRLGRGAYPLDDCPYARTASLRIGAVHMSRHNTVSEARAAARAIRKVAGALLGDKGS
jgi:perosamine synthetase